jgi:hypothetical protein
MSYRRALAWVCAASLAVAWASLATAEDGGTANIATDGTHVLPLPEPHSILELRYIPTSYAQVAVWVEDSAGRFLATVALTEGVATRGIGNRPGASQMNSGFRWPYGRREGVLPVWAHRRAAAEGAKQFKRVIFQKRSSEGLASRTSDDYSGDNYFCLSFDSSRSAQDALDAVSCASVFNSDKGRFITQADVDARYGEPYVDIDTKVGSFMPLGLHSLYPPRRDVDSCAPSCYEHSDVAEFDAHAHEVMPDIDAVTTATPAGDELQRILYTIPTSWGPGDYRTCIEVNVEGDHNETWSAERFPTPAAPDDAWDSWAIQYGYPYRGQPSVVYCTPFSLGGQQLATFTSDTPEGSAGSWDTAAAEFGELRGMHGMTDDAAAAPGSGADRLRLNESGDRVTVVVKPPMSCMKDQAPEPVGELRIAEHDDELHAHEWASLSFLAADDDVGIFRYEVRVSTEPMPDLEAFMRGAPAKNASLQAEELRIPTTDRAGERVTVQMGGLVAQTRYYVGIRVIDTCANASEIRVVELTTPERTFATVTPCFVATAAYGTPMAHEIEVLRRLRDRHLKSNFLGRRLVATYEAVGPKLADAIRDDESLRAAARALLAPLVTTAALLVD